jgi:hypothetical protein
MEIRNLMHPVHYREVLKVSTSLVDSHALGLSLFWRVFAFNKLEQANL